MSRSVPAPNYRRPEPPKPAPAATAHELLAALRVSCA